MKEHELPENTGRLIGKLGNAINTQVNREVGQYNLTSSQVDVLNYLIHRQGQETNQRDLERQLGISNPTVTGIVQRLEAKGLIRREQSETTRSAKRLILTERALELSDIMIRGTDNLERELVKGVSDEELETFTDVLHRMLKNLGL